jgi:formylglycine-generating enzyme required for sulfatase activity
MRMKPGHLSLHGYRLPTEAEWEFACRAGAVTSRYYGETAELLGEYAWYAKNSQDRGMLPPGARKPNDLGLFDMYGNAFEWCQDGSKDFSYGYHGDPVADDSDKEDCKNISDRLSRMVRGGAYWDPALNLRSALRNRNVPAFHFSYLGFRVARTYR